MNLPSWLGTSFWSIVDQATFAIANFFLNIILARELPATDYGIFSIIFSVYILSTTIHSALIIEPMLVFGIVKYSKTYITYLSKIMLLNWIISCFIGVLLIVSGIFCIIINQSKPGGILISLGFSLPAILLGIFLRRSTYVENKQYIAGIFGVFYLLFLGLLTIFLLDKNLLTSWNIFLLMGLTNLIISIFIWNYLKNGNSFIKLSFKKIIYEHWEYGKWSVPANLLSWIPWNAPYLILSRVSGLESTAYLRAYMNLIQPILQFIGALNSMILPYLSKLRGSSSFYRKKLQISVIVGSLTVGYWLLLGLTHDILIKLIYKSRYTEFSWLLWLLGFLAIIEGQIVINNSALRSKENTRGTFFAYLIGSFFITILCLLLVNKYALLGVVVSMIISFLSILISTILINSSKIEF